MSERPAAPVSLPMPSPAVWRAFSDYVRSAFGVQLTDEMLGRFAAYCAELVEWNARFNLVSFRSTDEIVWRHFADSLAGLALIDRFFPHGSGAGIRVIDVGAGAGFPGVPVKIARPDIRLTLLESITKKCSFLEHLQKKLSLVDTAIVNERAETFAQRTGDRESFDAVLSRAVSKLSPNLEIALPLAKAGGYALVYKTERFVAESDEMTGASRALDILGGKQETAYCYDIPHEDKRYCVVAFRKTAATPAAYPRRPGTPEKKPL